MHEDKREVITKEMILQQFKRGAGIELPIYGVASAFVAVLCFVFASAFVKELAKSVESRSDGFAVFAGIITVVFAAFVVFGVYKIVQLIKTIRNDDGQQIIIERAKFLSYVEFDPWHSLMDHGYDVVTFEGGKEYRIYHDKRNGSSCPSRLSVWLQLSGYGDTYIIVTMKNDPQTVVDLYSEKFFIYKE